jgi:hypothetical protein
MGEIPGHRVTGAAMVEIEGMTGGGLGIRIDTCENREAGALQPE